MRFNDRELLPLSKKKPLLEGVLQYAKPLGTRLEWYSQPVFKERIFKLIKNFLFYYRVNDLTEPIGVIVLESMQVSYEPPGPAFAFSLTFTDGKYIFSCRCQDDVNKWVAALKESSCQYWRSMYTMLQTKISSKTGKEAVLVNDLRSTSLKVEIETTMKTVNKSTFYYTENTTNKSDNLIDL